MTTQEAAVFFVRALTPVHIGADAGVGAINLPTMREAITQHPLIPASSLKGVLRDALGLSVKDEPKTSTREWAAFGPSRANAAEYRGGLVLSDARLLLLPVASLKGTFAWTTSYSVLRRLNQDLRDAGQSALQIHELSKDDVLIPDRSALRFEDGRISLREVLTVAKHRKEAAAIADEIAKSLWKDEDDREFFRERFAILPDDVFNAFARSALEVRARVAIDSDTGTAGASGPWLEEHIPAETILCGLAFGRKTKEFEPSDMVNVFTGHVGGLEGKAIRIGGHSSIGLGRVFLTCTGGK